MNLQPESAKFKQQGIQELFETIWGYKNFRFPQAEVIDCLLAGKDVIIVMPTGGGKSICFQLPALFQEGLTLVVSPLIALMENQVRELKDRQLSVDCLHSELPRAQRKIILNKIQQKKLRLLYVSPEILLSQPIWEVLCQPDLEITGLMIDEAHCLVEWGESFRPAYRRLGIIRSALLAQKFNQKKFSIAAFTATADPFTQAQLKSILQLENPEIFVLSPYRSNLKIAVKIAWSAYCRQHLLLNFLEKYKRKSGLIYVRSRSDSEFLSQWLRTLKYKTAAYHAGLGARERRTIEEQWLTGNLSFVVCTNAFGLGINKPDIRWIVHFHPPHLLSEYLQEIGRGGRDGLVADTLVLISEPTGWLDSTDQQRRNFFNQQRQKQSRKAWEIAQKIPSQANILDLKKTFPDLEISLAFLHQLGQLQWLDPFHYQLHLNSQHQLSVNSSQFDRLSGQSMKQYLYTKKCRWAFLLTTFGLKDKSNFKCGHCDRCLKNKLLSNNI